MLHRALSFLLHVVSLSYLSPNGGAPRAWGLRSVHVVKRGGPSAFNITEMLMSVNEAQSNVLYLDVGGETFHTNCQNQTLLTVSNGQFRDH